MRIPLCQRSGDVLEPVLRSQVGQPRGYQVVVFPYGGGVAGSVGALRASSDGSRGGVGASASVSGIPAGLVFVASVVVGPPGAGVSVDRNGSGCEAVGEW